MGRVHLVGAAQAGLGDGGRRRGLRDLAIAIAAGAVVWGVDAATGGRLAGAVNAFAARLAGWYEERREPVVVCEPGAPRAYTVVPGIVFQVPRCWEVETSSLLDKEIHRFHDPEARAGTLSVSVEPIESDEDRGALSKEFAQMAALPGARVDGVKGGGAKGDAVKRGGGKEEDAPHAKPWKPSVPDSLAERILHEEESASSAGASGPAPSGTAQGEPSPAASRARAFHVVEAGGLLGAPPREGRSARLPDGSYAKRTWSWLLLGDREAVRIVYAVRADWSETVVVANEFKRADAVARSVTPAP